MEVACARAEKRARFFSIQQTAAECPSVPGMGVELVTSALGIEGLSAPLGGHMLVTGLAIETGQLQWDPAQGQGSAEDSGW